MAQRILEAAKQIVSTAGVDGLRIGDISAALGVSTPALYAHFPGGRSEIVARVAAEGLSAMQAFFPRTGGPPRDDLLDGVTALVRFYAENRAFLRMMLLDFSSAQGHASITQQIGPARGKAADGAFQPMFDRLETLISGCSPRTGPTAVSASILLNIIVGSTALNLIYPPPHEADPGSAVEAIVRDLVVRYLGLAPDAEGSD